MRLFPIVVLQCNSIVYFENIRGGSSITMFVLTAQRQTFQSKCGATARVLSLTYSVPFYMDRIVKKASLVAE